MQRSLCVLLALVPVIGLCAPVQAAKKTANPGSIRFLCVTPELPPKYRKLPNGAYTAIPYDFDECPPSSLFLKRGSEYRACSFTSNGISRPQTRDVGGAATPHEANGGGASHAKAAEGYYVRDTGAAAEVVLDAQGQSIPDGKHGAVSKGKRGAEPGAESKDAWRLLLKSPPADGKDYLLCLFQPMPAGKWYPPASAQIDISPEAFPSDRCLVINCTLLPVYAQIGAGTQPMALKPSGGFGVSAAAPSAEGRLAMKVAVSSANAMTVAINREMDLPPGRRAVLVVYPSAATVSGPAKAKVKYYLLDETPEKDLRASLPSSSGAKISAK